MLKQAELFPAQKTTECKNQFLSSSAQIFGSVKVSLFLKENINFAMVSQNVAVPEETILSFSFLYGLCTYNHTNGFCLHRTISKKLLELAGVSFQKGGGGGSHEGNAPSCLVLTTLCICFYYKNPSPLCNFCAISCQQFHQQEWWHFLGFSSFPHSWSAKLYLTPSNIVLLTAIALIGVCVFILAIIGILHWQEKVSLLKLDMFLFCTTNSNDPTKF